MTVATLIDALQASALSRYLAGANHLLTAALQVVHILGFVVLLASALLFAFRIHGVVFRNSPLAAVARDAYLLMVLGLGLAAVTGTLMVIAAPHHYLENPAFQVKLVLLSLAAITQFTTISCLPASSAPTLQVRLGVVLSAALWLGVSFAGRAIGFI